MHQQQTTFENILGKGEIACNEQFLLFPQCFLLNQITVSPFVHIFDIISLFAAEFEKPKIGIWGKGLKAFKGSLSNPLPNNKILDLNKLIAICRRQIWLKQLKNVLGTVQNIMGKCFQQSLSSGSFNSLPHDPNF